MRGSKNEEDKASETLSNGPTDGKGKSRREELGNMAAIHKIFENVGHCMAFVASRYQ